MIIVDESAHGTKKSYVYADIPVGTVFRVKASSASPLVDKTLLKTYNGLVDLSDPNYTWSVNSWLDKQTFERVEFYPNARVVLGHPGDLK